MREANAEGRWEKLENCMRAHGTGLLRLATLYLKDASLAADAVQEAFLKAYRHMDGFRGDSEVSTWITRILMNTCNNMLRTGWMRRVRAEDSARAMCAWDAYPDSTGLDAVARLPARLRAAVLLRYYREMRVKDIAKALGISESAVKQRLKRAGALLRKRLEGWYFDE